MDNNEPEINKNEIVKQEPTTLWPAAKPLFVFRFESGNLSKSKYVVTAKTKEEALDKLRDSLGEDDVSHLKFESMVEWKIETETKSD